MSKITVDSSPPFDEIRDSIRRVDHLLRAARSTAKPERRGVVVARLTNVKRHLREAVAELERAQQGCPIRQG
jgi:hypothetical protein